jgi:arylsulfatase A
MGMNTYLRSAIVLATLMVLARDIGAQTTSARPNVVVILADGLGWADLGCYGNKDIDTPNLDRLAAQGMRFTDAYAPAPICSPSRAALLTGKSPARLQFEFVTKPDNSAVPPNTLLAQPEYPRDLPLRESTLAELVMPRGYRTGFFGKWHLTQENDAYLGWGIRFGPLQQGFSEGLEHRGSHPMGIRRWKKHPSVVIRKANIQ